MGDCTHAAPSVQRRGRQDQQEIVYFRSLSTNVRASSKRPKYLSVHSNTPTLGFLASLSGLPASCSRRYSPQKSGPDLADLIRLVRAAGPQKKGKPGPARVSGQGPTSLIGAKQFMLLQSRVSGSRILISGRVFLSAMSAALRPFPSERVGGRLGPC